MRRTIVRRTAVAASAVSLALLVGACGSSDKPAADSSSEGKEKGKENAPAGKVLTKAELDKLMLVDGDLKNHKVTNASEADLASVKAATTDKAECKPLLDAMTLQSGGKPAATSVRKIMAMPTKPAENASPEEKAKAGLSALGATITSDVLGSYEGKGAQEALAKLSAAGKACAGGFTMIVGSDKTKINKVEPATFSGGDEAVAFTLTLDAEGATNATHVVASRKGSTLATLFAMSLAGKAEQPKAVADAQLGKLG
ncbi:hypothetical protein [Streptomyces syringium]|uniref:hypothetical protein n=1 Tax=Streptomyces syringium TaxID=76729 RepID=UPI003AAFF94D